MSETQATVVILDESVRRRRRPRKSQRRRNHRRRNRNARKKKRSAQRNDHPPECSGRADCPGAPVPTEEGRNTPDPRRELRLNCYLSEDQQMALQACLPHRKLVCKGTKPPKPHPVAHACRADASEFLISKCRETKTDPVILDVGGGPISYSKFVHACECSREGYTIQKIKTWMSKFPGACLGDGEVHDNTKWTFCDCLAQECIHFQAGKPDVAMFLHSVYYNRPVDVAKIILKTSFQRGFSIQHQFTAPFGTFYGGEAKYHRVKKHIEMALDGNSHVYSHPNPSWLLDPKGFTVVRVGGKKYKLLFTTEPHYTGNTHFTIFDIVPHTRKLKVTPSGKKLPKIEPELEKEEVLLDERGLKVVISGSKARVSTRNDVHLLPLRIVADLRRYAAGTALDPKQWRNLLGHARRLVRKESNPDFDGFELADVATALTMAVIRQTTARELPLFEAFFTENYREEVELYNSFVGFNKWRKPWVHIVVDLALLLLIVAFCACLTLSPEVYGLSYMVVCFVIFGIMTLIEFLRYKSRMKWPYLLATIFGSMIRVAVRAASQTLALVNMPSLVIILVCAGVVVKRASTTANDFDLDYYIHIERRMPHYDGEYPYGYTVNAFETLVNPDVYPLHESAFLDGELTGGRLDPKPSLNYLGPMFTAAVPITFSRSDHNLVVAVKTRALVDAQPKVEKGRRKLAWEILARNCDAELDIQQCSGSVCAPGHCHHTEWNEYLARFPPAKRKSMERAKEHLTNGTWRPSQFCYTGFVKREKQMLVGLFDYVPTRPRLIQGMSVIMKISKGQWFLDYSGALKYCWHIHNHIWYSSGCTADEQSHWMNYHALRLGTFEVLFSDFSKYDVTQGDECMSRERQHYRDLGFCEDQYGEHYLRAAARSRVYAKGMQWSVNATRKSGDNNTSSGNTKNTGESIWAWFAPRCRAVGLIPEQHIAIAALGDDNFALVSARFLDLFGREKVVSSLTSWMDDLGYVVKAGLTGQVVQAEYLSLRFYPVDGEYVVGKKPGRVLSKIGAQMHRQGRSIKTCYEYWKGALQSYMPTSNHVPFLRRYVSICLERLAGLQAKHDAEDAYRAQGRLHEATDDTWAAFMDVYGADLNQEAEDQFAERLREKPLNYVHDMPCVERMFQVDFEM